ncbi:hypothetical protein FACS189490_04760 [Clostridia bacterium]|nr:hypothetical protein FACS189490_04760 [Clostridia bacterium]
MEITKSDIGVGIKTDIGLEIRELRKERGLSQIVLDESAGVTKSVVSKIESAQETAKYNGAYYRASKYLYLKIFMVLKLPLNQMEELIQLANVYFGSNNNEDIIIKKAIKSGEYNIWIVSDELSKRGLKDVFLGSDIKERKSKKK